MRTTLVQRAREIRQRGAAAIEFALLFVIFFAVFYAVVSYSVAMLLQQSFAHAAAEGARSALAVNPLNYPTTADFQSSGVEPRVRSIVGQALAWLPAKVKGEVLGPDNAKVVTEFNNNILTVRIVYTGYRTNPLIPRINLPLIGEVPRLPDNLTGSAAVNL